MAERDTGPGGIYSRLADIGHGPARFIEDVSARMPTLGRIVNNKGEACLGSRYLCPIRRVVER
jgi:hypothetical protein